MFILVIGHSFAHLFTQQTFRCLPCVQLRARPGENWTASTTSELREADGAGLGGVVNTQGQCEEVCQTKEIPGNMCRPGKVSLLWSLEASWDSSSGACSDEKGEDHRAKTWRSQSAVGGVALWESAGVRCVSPLCSDCCCFPFPASDKRWGHSSPLPPTRVLWLERLSAQHHDVPLILVPSG